jgi:hypothetical protein
MQLGRAFMREIPSYNTYEKIELYKMQKIIFIKTKTDHRIEN